MTDTTEGPEFVLRSGAYFLQNNRKTWAVGINNAGRMTRGEAEDQKRRFESHDVVTIHRAKEFMLPQPDAAPVAERPRAEIDPGWIIGDMTVRETVFGFAFAIPMAERPEDAVSEISREDARALLRFLEGRLGA